MKILITGGAGFVGSSLAKSFKEKSQSNEVTCLDNLKRRGAELNLSEFRKMGINFIHGDIRNREDLESLSGSFDLLVEASAEPSVHAGVGSSPDYLLNTNLLGTLNCLEFARKRVKILQFLSTSRVYSIPTLRNLPLTKTKTRLKLNELDTCPGISNQEVLESFDTSNYRSLYGTTKLSSEFFVQEYSKNYGLKSFINRCGVLCGEGQWGKTDQGVFTLWVARHLFGGKLSYTGFGGLGFQVRDLLHPADLFDLIQKQIEGELFDSPPILNIGGGLSNSVSLLEYTKMVERITGRSLDIKSDPQTAEMDIPYYVSNYSKAKKLYDWKPKVKTEEIIERILKWINKNEKLVKPFFT